jgi:D-glycero-D-manno-heptose 1,7-bisphosphate phosphatase
VGVREVSPEGRASRAVFLDRDGVITSKVFSERWGEWEAPMVPEDAVLLPNVAEALSSLQSAGFLLFIVSNQGAFAKGKIDLRSLLATANRVNDLLLGSGIVMTDSYYSFTHPLGVVKDFSGASLERKPSPYFLHLAAAAYNIDLPNSWMIGDRLSDILCGRSAGCKVILLSDGGGGEIYDNISPDATAGSLYEAASIILGSPAGRE